jgi:MraZ protein
MTSKTGRDYARMLFASAEQGVPDKQGRISLTPSLREYAAITRDVVVIGAMDRVEIWEPTRWREYSASAQEKFAELDEERLTD